MSSSRISIELIIDVVSPYTCLAFEVLTRYCSSGRWNAKLTIRPVFLGGVMAATGNKPPVLVPARGVYMQADVARLSEFFKVPLSTPSTFPTNTLAAMRLLTVVAKESPADVERVARELWTRSWGRDLDIQSPASLLQTCLDVGISKETAERWLQASTSQETKDALKAATEDAVARGAFGAPTMFITTPDGKTDMFFGSDRYELIAHMYKLPWAGPCPDAKSQAKL
eukprot:TRINITY_DN16556_c0_g1_i1.p1 TRINITY_DN16556_c0_g1~~TRINITY_DN16556_c0_g1_i1.p1  ORF type:complete len:226 (+),score=59.94 TRINITY_DN16556_c0_g1_i1:54-731(+)